ncbi:MAG: MCE family protein [Candidatus Coatesbacteria bacterium]|nr:MCE family protein [Candidatus Coatesbacteria bacterium]
MKSASAREIRVGLFVILAVVLFGAFVFSIGGRSRLLQPKYRLVAYFGSVSGLVAGAPVMLEGVDVGTVEDIELLLDPMGKRVRVTLVIETSVQDKIRTDSKARIETMGVLGDKYIEITMGSFDKKALEDGTILRSVEPTDYNALLKSGQSVLERLDDASGSLAQILKKIDEGQGLAGAVVNEEINVKDVMDSFVTATKSLQGVLDDVKLGQGTLGMLLYDHKARDNVTQLLSSLDRITMGIQEGKGTLGKLAKDDALYERLTSDIGESARLLKSLLASLQFGEGLFPKLLSEESTGQMLSDANAAIRNLNEAAVKLNSAAQKIDSGEGTLGKLINDPALYDDLLNLMRGAKKSWFVRRLIKKGEKEAEKSDEKKDGEQSGE